MYQSANIVPKLCTKIFRPDSECTLCITFIFLTDARNSLIQRKIDTFKILFEEIYDVEAISCGLRD